MAPLRRYPVTTLFRPAIIDSFVGQSHLRQMSRAQIILGLEEMQALAGKLSGTRALAPLLR
jgi:hypothetical protein